MVTKLKRPQDSRPSAGARRRNGPADLLRQRRVVVFASLLVTFVLWEALGRSVNPILFGAPSAVFSEGYQFVLTADFWLAAASTTRGIVVGFALAGVMGVTIGLANGRYKWADWSTDAQITWLYVTPNIVFIPLLIVWFGLGESLKVALVILASIFPIMIATRDGARLTGTDVVDVARVEGASERQVMMKIIIPGSVPYIMTGLRLGLGRAMVGMIVAEMFTQLSGLGGLIMHLGFAFQTAKLLFVIFVIGVFGWALTASMGLVEQRFARWKFEELGGKGVAGQRA